ncbi:MAG: hypothetical protein Kow0059_21910 [Candidatus Sumerlaeia bacterium]
MKHKHAFTLIELLIVVAIIAILAAIAVPNFLEAQVRSKVSRTKADIRSLATAIEAYAVDHNTYPIDGYRSGDNQAFWYVPGGPTVVGGVAGVTSPIAYMSSVKLVDPFRLVKDAQAAKAADAPDSNYFEVSDYTRYRYVNSRYTWTANSSMMTYFPTIMEAYGEWRLIGNGPDAVYNSDTVAPPGSGFTPVGLNPVYDPTNGTVSRGDIIRSQKHGEQPGPHGPGY